MVESPTSPSPDNLASDEQVVGEGIPRSPISRRIDRLPVEVGVLLMAAGVTTGVLPPTPGPFDLTIIASGGLILWPRGFRAIDGWTQRCFPGAHRAAMCFLSRFLDDLERRFPDSVNNPSSLEETSPIDR
jgi:hypothetical protein